MDIPLKDRSNYLRGLLILAKKKGYVSQSDETIISHVSGKLGFSSRFCEETLSTLLENDFINGEPVRFVNKVFAKSFISDALKLACTRTSINPEELNWIKRSAETNHLNHKWFANELARCRCLVHKPTPTQLTLYSII